MEHIDQREEQQQRIFTLLREQQRGVEALQDAMRAGGTAEKVAARLRAFGFDIRQRQAE